MQYRADIQIMQGIAVILVVLFHLNFNAFANGFLGVDIFFVLSGFLMAVLYKQGDVKGFYRRRATRLLPAYFATIIATVILSALITIASDHQQVVNQSIWATFFSSNIGFWNQDSYFSTKYFNPLLHLWSLGVELQFYLLVPFLFWLYFRNRILFFIVFLISLLSCFAMTYINSKTSFFLTPFRIWQLLAGSLIAFLMTDKGSVRYEKPMLGLFALIALGAVLAWYPINITAENIFYGHPGLATLLTTILMAMILAFGLPKTLSDSHIGKFFAKIGDWSYSIYLVHFPVIVLCLYVPLNGTILAPDGWVDTLKIIALIIISTSVVYLFFDRRRWNISFRSSAISMAVILLISAASVPLSQLKQTELEQNIMQSYDDRGEFRCGRLARILDEFNVSGYFACEITSGMDASAEPVLLLGDSTADAIKSSLASQAAQNHIRLYTTASNRAASGKLSLNKVIRETKKLEIKTIIIHFYSPYVSKVLEKDLNNKLKAAGFNVVWILPVPYFKEPVPKIAYGLKSNSGFFYAPKNRGEVVQINQRLAQDGIPLFNPWSLLCTDQTCEISDKSGHVYYHDSLHMSLTGAKKLEPLFNDVFKYINKINFDAHEARI